MEDIDLTMLARSAYRAILRSIETPEAEEPETVKEVVPMSAQKELAPEPKPRSPREHNPIITQTRRTYTNEDHYHV